jgi:hypothetical protein
MKHIYDRPDLIFLTKPQRQSVYRKYLRNANGAKSYKEFRRKVLHGGDYVGLVWCGMYVGIEKDGYAHT